MGTKTICRNSIEKVQICRMEYRFAIVGCGRIAEKHAACMTQLGKLVAVCDPDFQKAESLATLHHTRAYDSIEAMLAAEPSIDLVSICSPNGLHAIHAITALEHDKHVLCEKPLAISSQDALQMIDTAKRCHKKLLVVKSSRYTPCIRALQAAITSHQLGKIYSFHLNAVWNRPDAYYENSWKGTLSLDGGTLFTQFSHYLDALLWLLGDVQEIHGFRTRASHQSIEVEDSGTIALSMKSGAIGSLHYSVNAFEKNVGISLEIVAEKGTVQLGGAYMNEVVYQQPVLLTEEMLSAYPSSHQASNHELIFTDVINVLDGKESNMADGDVALKTVELIEKIYQEIPL